MRKVGALFPQFLARCGIVDLTFLFLVSDQLSYFADLIFYLHVFSILPSEPGLEIQGNAMYL